MCVCVSVCLSCARVCVCVCVCVCVLSSVVCSSSSFPTLIVTSSMLLNLNGIPDTVMKPTFCVYTHTHTRTHAHTHTHTHTHTHIYTYMHTQHACIHAVHEHTAHEQAQKVAARE